MKKFSQIHESKANPWYKKGQLLIKFTDDVNSDDVADYIIKRIGVSIVKDAWKKPLEIQVVV